MLISSDSDDDSEENIWRRLERNKRHFRANLQSLNYNNDPSIDVTSETYNSHDKSYSSKIINHTNDDVILVSETYNSNRRPYSSDNVNLTNDDVILVSDSCVRKPNNLVGDLREDVVSNSKNYDSTNLFLNDAIVVPDAANSRTRSKRKSAIGSDAETVSKSKRGRGSRRGTKKSANDSLSTSPAKSTSARGRRGRGGKTKPSITPLTPDLPFLEPTNASSRRGRGKKKKNIDILSTLLTPGLPLEPARGRGRGRGGRSRGLGRKTNTNSSSPITPETPRRSGRQRRGRSQTRPTSTPPSQPLYPTYSIGNTCDYPDASENCTLFASVSEQKPVANVDASLDNEELSIKVLWQSIEVITFKIRRLQKLSQIFNFFCDREGVSKSNLLFMYNNRTLAPDDTPDSIDYDIVKFIDGGVTSSGLSLPPTESNKTVVHGFKLKFQCQGKKQPYEVGVGKDEKLQIAMVKCAEFLEIPIANLRFEFDGETVHGNVTPKDMDMDNGDCIDVKILNVKK